MDPSSNPIIAGKPPHPLLIIISGPSGVGKDSVLMRMRELGFPFHFVVTMNSRPPRSGEIPGVDYHFVTNQQFEAMIEQGEMLEWARVYNQYKGVPKFEVRQALQSGRDVVMRVNVDGALTIKGLAPEAVMIYIAPGSSDELRHRLRVRGTETEHEIVTRLTEAEVEQQYIKHFDYVVINRENQLDTTVGTIRAIITAEKHRVFARHLSL
ncbi:MAG: guanylate kinase [Chloroflexaceae bacterium]|nr:guanylate kinase [Chloroflexaceae bacterium]NJO04545.1 guanylate kinase [Chloroflexaceae bacterium]